MIQSVLLAAVTLMPNQFSGLPLSSAVEQAVAISPDVAQARERVNENAALLAAARGIAAPALTANYVAAPQGGPSNTTITQSLTTIGGQIVLGDFLTSAPAVRQAYFTLAGAQFDLLDAQRSERIKVVGQYYDALKTAATVELRRQDYAGAESDLRAAQVRFHAGDAPRLDVVRAQVALANAEANLESARVDFANAQNALSVETGAPPASFSKMTPAPFAALAALSPGRAVERALAQRSDYLSALQAVHAEEAAVRAAQRSIFPAVTLSGGYTSGVDSGVVVHGPSANVTVALPISQAAHSRAQAERARLAEATDKAGAIRRQISVQVSAAARTYQESIRATASASRARAAAQEELRATQIGYRNGASSSLDVADARRTYVQAALNELSAVYAQAQAAATLQEEMGP
jgi:cobalt-zinc-cadmium efflux system outer membrane protein